MATASAQEPLTVRKLSFQGNRSIDDYTIATAIETTNSSAFATLPLLRKLGLGAKRSFSQRALERDVERVRLLYRIHGFLEVQVDTVVRRTERDVYISFRIKEGEPVLLRRMEIRGLDSLSDPESVLRNLPMRVGDPFNRFKLGQLSDSLGNRLRDRGYPAARVFLASRTVDSVNRSAEVDLRVVTGRLMVVGEIQVEGARDRGDSLLVGSFLSTTPGRPFRQADLFRSQRNLALSDLYRFASVDIDSARFSPTGDAVPLLIRVVPGPQQRVSGSLGFGTDDCFRGSAGWIGRNALGRGRILETSARLSKLGVGEPTDIGLASSFLCSRLKQDSIGSSRMNYSLSSAVRQPGFFGPRTSLTVGAFAELVSEFRVYARQSLGLSLVATTEIGARIPVTIGYRLSHGQTDANDANFCAYFNACTRGDIETLRARQRQGVVSAGISNLRVDDVLDPKRGYSLGAQVSYSGTLTGSEELQRFTKVTGDATLYRSLSRKVVVAGRLRAGVLLSPTTFTGEGGEPFSYVPPEWRLYAGGPYDVRGYDGNQLGPVVYVVLDTTYADSSAIPSDKVVVSPIGGNRSLIGNLEARFPSPIFGSFTTLAVFADAGALWEERDGVPSGFRVRITPGVGVRVATPLGPARLDMAYNPYGFPPGDLYKTLPDGSLFLFQREYVKSTRPRFTIHFAIGQAF